MKLSLTSIIPLLTTCLLLFPTQALPHRIKPPFPSSPLHRHRLAKAQKKWRADTSIVSRFLSSVPTLLLLQQQQQQQQGGADLAAAAKIALAAENDELLHKAVLDAAFIGSGNGSNGTDERIVAADDVLVGQGTFQTVVDALEQFASDGDDGAGMAMTPGQADALLRETNAVRCGRVLPAIDTYFRVVGERLGLEDGDVLVATRPRNC